MTLNDLGLMIRHYTKTIVFISIAFALLSSAASFVIPDKYEATASITASDPSGNVSPASMLAVVNDFVQADIAPYTVEDSKIEASAELGSGVSGQTVTITVMSSDKDECVALANSIAAAAAADSEGVFEALQEANEAGLADLSALNTSEDAASVLSGSLLQDSLGSDRTFEFCSFLVADAIEARNSKPGTITLAVMGLIGGFLLALLVVIVLDVVKSPIRSRKDAEATTGLPVFGFSSSAIFGDQLWANIQFALNEVAGSVCLVPVSAPSSQICATELSEAIVRSDGSACIESVGEEVCRPVVSELGRTVVYQCEPLACGVGTIYCAHGASATIVCAKLWEDSRVALGETVRELALAGANVVGIALIDRFYGEQRAH